MSDASPRPENRSRAELRLRQSERLQRLVKAIIPANPFWTQRFAEAGLTVDDLKTPDDLRRLPPVAKSDLARDQSENPPYGTNLTFPFTQYCRLHQTSGTTGQPLRWLDTHETWSWFEDCWEQIYRLVGIHADDRFAFPFSFGPFIGFWAAFDGAARLGRLCVPLGGLGSEARLRMLIDHQVTIVCCTPTYALRLAEVAREKEIDLAGSPVRGLIVAGEAGGNIPSTRKLLEEEWGARVFDHWGMTEIGSLAIEPADNPGGLDVLETECIAEVVNPESHEPVGPGETGELWITNLGRVGSPLLRYRTGDLVRIAPQPSSGRSLLRLDGGIQGRVDDMITVRGNNVFPSHLEAILREFHAVAEYRITVEKRRAMDHLTIEIEPVAESAEGERSTHLLEHVRKTLKDRLHFQVDVTLAAVGSLPRFEMKGRRFVRKPDSK